MVDELIYSELARSLAAGHGLEVRGEPYLVSLIYPLLLAPVYAVFDSLPDAYAAVKVVNAVVMSLAAVPAYLLARRVLPTGLSLLAALLAVALPSMVYTGTVMTENAFYPAFLLVRLGARPDARAADEGGAAARARARRRHRAHPRAGDRAPARGPDRAAPASPRAALVRAAVRNRARRWCARRPRAGRSRRIALEPARRVQGRRRDGLRRRPGRAVPALARRRARPLPRRLPARRVRAAARARADARPAAAGVPRRNGGALRVGAARRLHVRVAVRVEPDPGAEHVLPRAALPRRAAGLGRPRRAATARGRSSGRGRPRGAARP